MERRRSSGTITKIHVLQPEKDSGIFADSSHGFHEFGTGPECILCRYGGPGYVPDERRGLVAAVEEAIESGHEITADDLGFTNGRRQNLKGIFRYEGCRV